MVVCRVRDVHFSKGIDWTKNKCGIILLIPSEFDFQVSIMFNGGSIGFYSGDMRLFNDDIRQLKPTMIPAVPNVLNRMYEKVTGIFKLEAQQHREIIHLIYI